MKTNIRTSIPTTTFGILLGIAGSLNATVIGFGNVGGNNANIETIGAPGLPGNTFGSFAAADSNGLVVSNGTTPNIGVSWGPGTEWDIHTSSFFAPIEDKTVGGGSWDNEGSVPRVGQLDYGGTSSTLGQSINFSVNNPNVAFVLNSFDFGHTAETAGNTSWTLRLYDSSAIPVVVWSQAVSFTNGQVQTIVPNFTGQLGQGYSLNFFRETETYGSGGRHAIDNLSFSQVPEPSAAALFGAAGLALLVRRRK